MNHQKNNQKLQENNLIINPEKFIQEFSEKLSEKIQEKNEKLQKYFSINPMEKIQV